MNNLPRYGEPLTERQIEILDLVSRGNTDQRVADRMGISRTAVHYHLKASYSKLGAYDRAHAVRKCFEQGIFPIGR